MAKVTALCMDTITKKSNHVMTPCAVSVCLTPAAPSPLPIPYPVVANISEGIVDPPMRTKFDGAAIGTVGSCFKKCHGNEAGTLKEVVSLNTAGPCFLVMGAPVVLIELGMAGITGSPGFLNKSITVGAGANASGAGGAGGGGGGGGGSSASGPSGGQAQAPTGGGGGPAGGTNTGATGPSATAEPTHAQEEPMSCGMAASRMVVHSETGTDPGEAAMRTESQNHGGAYDPVNGTQMDNLTNVMQSQGVNASNPTPNQTIDNLATATAGGNPAVVHVEHSNGGGHFVVVDGVTTHADGSRTVEVRDPGGGVARSVPESDMNNDFYGNGSGTQFTGWAITTN